MAFIVAGSLLLGLASVNLYFVFDAVQVTSDIFYLLAGCLLGGFGIALLSIGLRGVRE